MPKRKCENDDDESYDSDSKNVIITNNKSRPLKKKVKTVINFEQLPEVKNLDDLIKIGETSKFYKNINMFMLWNILPHLKDLQSMIGMKNVKESIFIQVIYYLQGLHERNIGGDYLHTIITGSPGCGKTTLAKILAKIFQNIGVLNGNGRFKIASREDFVGEYLGSTAVKTKKLLTSCLGGAIFVDELYSLGPGQKDKDSYSKEAIDTINLFLSEHKNDLFFIAAGYKEEIDKCFFSVNQGLKRRFAWFHNIDAYEVKDLVNIFTKMVKDINWDTKIPENELRDIFSNNKYLFKDAGGSIEILLSKIKLTHSVRVFGKDNDEKFIIKKEDIDEAIKIMNKFEKKERNVTLDYYT